MNGCANPSTTMTIKKAIECVGAKTDTGKNVAFTQVAPLSDPNLSLMTSSTFKPVLQKQRVSYECGISFSLPNVSLKDHGDGTVTISVGSQQFEF